MMKRGSWIPVEYELPAVGQQVIATDGEFVGEAYLSGGSWWYRPYRYAWSNVTEYKVVAWMPMPEPPDLDEIYTITNKEKNDGKSN